jgi:DNA modification methylase
VFPVDLPLFFINLLSPPDGLVVDPFAGSGTTGIAAVAVGRRCLLIDNNPKYCELSLRRIHEESVEVKAGERNGRYSSATIETWQQDRLLEGNDSSKKLPKRKPVTYARPKRR